MADERQIEWTPEKVQAFWDFESRFPERYFGHTGGEALVRRLQRWLPAAGRVMDLGCGGGHMLERLLDAGYRAAGTDQSPASLAQVTKRLAGREGFLGARTSADWVAAGERFDVVMILEVVEHLDDEALAGILSAATDLLSPTGLLVITTPNREQLEREHIRCPECLTVFHRWQHVRSWSRASLSAHLQGVGFAVEIAFTTDLGVSVPKPTGRRFKDRRRLKKYERRLAEEIAQPDGERPNLVVIARPTASV